MEQGDVRVGVSPQAGRGAKRGFIRCERGKGVKQGGKEGGREEGREN